MLSWAALPLALQALAMLADELIFHRRRGLPRWERLGHPLDTLSVFGCYAFALSRPPSDDSLVGYVALAAFSCLFVTKDEWVHRARCEPAEQWLHALLFVLHPIVLGIGALLWWQGERGLLWASASATASFGLYQVLYWSIPWKRLAWSLSTTRSTIRSGIVGTTPTTTRSLSCAPNRDSEIRG